MHYVSYLQETQNEPGPILTKKSQKSHTVCVCVWVGEDETIFPNIIYINSIYHTATVHPLTFTFKSENYGL